MNKTKTMDTLWSVGRWVNLFTEAVLFCTGIYSGAVRGNYAQGAFYLVWTVVLILIDRNWWP